jgi:MFS family permease
MQVAGPLVVLRRVLSNRSLRRVLFAYFAFHVAEFATWVAILLYAYDRTGPASVGLVALIQLVPAALAATPASSLGDRYPRERVLAAGYVVQAIAILATAAAMAADVPAPVVYAFAGTAAMSFVVTRPTQSSLLPSLARTPEELTAANGAVGVVEGAGVLAGPLLAAGILIDSTTTVVFLVGGAVLLVAAIATIGLRPVGGLAALRLATSDPVDPDQVSTTSISPVGLDDALVVAAGDRSFLAGLRVVAGDRDARLIVGLLTVRTLVVGCADVLFVLIALELVDTGDTGAAILSAAIGAGGIVGGALMVVFIGRTGLARVAAWGAIAWGVALVLIGVTASPFLAPILVIVGGAGLAAVDVAGRTLLQRSVRDSVLSRVFGLQEGLAMAALAIGSILVSILAEAFDLMTAIGTVALILPIVVVLSWTRIRALDLRNAVPIRTLELLRVSTLFAPLPGPQLEAVARRAVWLSVPAATTVIREGDAGDRYYVLADGAVDVEQGGRHVRTLDRVGDGFGEIALLRDVPRTATVVAATDLTLLAIDRAPFLVAVTGHPDAFAAAEQTIDRVVGPGSSEGAAASHP